MGDAVGRSRRSNPVLRPIACLILRLGGWKIEGEVPSLKQMVAVFAHHTSNWDAIWMLTMRYVIFPGSVGWVAKSSVYRFPFRGLLNWLGCIPIDRNAPTGIVEQIAEAFESRGFAVVGLAPEGTRGGVTHWKTGFYRLAEAMDAPILLTFIDYDRRALGVGPLVEVTGDIHTDMRRIAEFYSTVTPKHPERAGEVAVYRDADD